MKKGKTKARQLILSSGFSWLFLLSVARSHKIVKLEPTLEKYIFGIAAQPLDGMLWIGGVFLALVISIIIICKPVAPVMTIIYLSIMLLMIIYNGMQTNLSIIETMKMTYLHIRKVIFLRR